MANLSSFSVATFNLYNLQEANKPVYQGRPWTDAEFKRKADWISAQLELLNADIVGLQELWSKKAIMDVIATRGLEQDYDVLAEPADGSRIVCGALVRKGLLIGEPEWVGEFPEQVKLQSSDDPSDPQAPHIDVSINEFSRPVIRFKVELRQGEPPTEVFVVHLKSKLPTRIDAEPWYDRDVYQPHKEAIGAGISTIRRTAEAVATRVMLNTVMKGTQTPVIVLGDINDGHTSNTANILTSQPGISSVNPGVELMSGCTLPRRCRNTAIAGMSTTHTCIWICVSPWTMCWSASSSMTTAGTVAGCSTAWSSTTTISTSKIIENKARVITVSSRSTSPTSVRR